MSSATATVRLLQYLLCQRTTINIIISIFQYDKIDREILDNNPDTKTDTQSKFKYFDDKMVSKHFLPFSACKICRRGLRANELLLTQILWFMANWYLKFYLEKRCESYVAVDYFNYRKANLPQCTNMWFCGINLMNFIPFLLYKHQTIPTVWVLYVVPFDYRLIETYGSAKQLYRDDFLVTSFIIPISWRYNASCSICQSIFISWDDFVRLFLFFSWNDKKKKKKFVPIHINCV